MPGFYASLWYGLWVPKDTPKPIIAKLNGAIVDALASPQVRTRLAELGPEIQPRDQQTPEAPRSGGRSSRQPTSRQSEMSGQR